MAEIDFQRFIEELKGDATDLFVQALLYLLEWTTHLSPSFRKNIEDFEATYSFKSQDDTIQSGARFNYGEMQVLRSCPDNWDVQVVFKNAQAFRRFLFSQNQDILDSILRNEVEVDGNLNLIYKFGFMARDLAYRLGI